MFYQGLQIRESSENHETVNRVIFVLECFTNARELNNENHEVVGQMLLIVLDCL